MAVFPTAPAPTALPRAEARRRKILEAALRLIARGGPDSITHRGIAAEAKVPLGSTTYHFASREELLREAFRHYVTECLGFLAALERELPPASLEGLADFLVEVTRREFADPSMILAEYELILYAARDEEVAAQYRAFAAALEARLAKMLESLGVTHPFEAARSAIAIVRGFELERLAGPAADESDLRARLLPLLRAFTTDTSPRVSRRSARRGSSRNRIQGQRRKSR